MFGRLPVAYRQLVLALFVFVAFEGATVGQDSDFWLQTTRESLLEGNCEKAQSSYNVYKDISGQTNDELEMRIKDCFNKGKASWRDEEVRSEIVIKEVSKKYTFYNDHYPSEREKYDKILCDVKKDYPKRMIGIGYFVMYTSVGWLSSTVTRHIPGSEYWEYTCKIKILEPNIRYYLNEAIRSANDGSRIALNQVLFMEGTDERLENQLMNILFDEGFRVVNSISNADYYINVKMDNNSLQIRMVNAVTGDYEGVSSVKYDGFIEEIKIGKGGECTSVEKIDYEYEHEPQEPQAKFSISN